MGVQAMTVSVTEDVLAVQLSDGRDISVPLSWYPRLVHATPEERGRWELIGGGEGIHWPDLDEDISVEMLLAGRKSGESRRSFKQWLEAKRAGRGLTLYELPVTRKKPVGEHDASKSRLDTDGPVITKHSKPVARVVPYDRRDADLIGSLRHKIEVKGDIFTTGVRWDADAES